MSPFTHLLASWAIADRLSDDGRDIALISWAGVAPDLDGLGLIPDFVNRHAGMPSHYYAEYHHFVLHGLLGALLIPATLCGLARWRLAVFIGGFAMVHLHLLADLLGSRGSDLQRLWPINYLGPFTMQGTVLWPGQWPLNGWPNIMLTLLLLAYSMWRAAKGARSPAILFGRRVNDACVRALRSRRTGAVEGVPAECDREGR
jgi:membrane-bound metal-dependent hydrolase YbcI (DUF457 family)